MSRSSDEPAAPPPARTPLFTDQQVVGGRYVVVRYIAHGGMGEVYEVFDNELRESVALKTIRPERAADRGVIDRFKREIHTARRITHPNVCRVFDLDFHDDVLFLTMELLRGETLAARIGRGRLAPGEAFPVVVQIAAALDAAHAAGVIHRDLKSANVMLVPDAARGPRAVVTDFGLARAWNADSAHSLSDTSVIVGTPAYMAPEQVEGQHLTPAVDIYALGVVLYEMLTARRPFTGGPALGVAARRLTENPASPRQHAPEIDPVWESAILRCLERDPSMRFGSGSEIVTALARASGAAGGASARSAIVAGAGPRSETASRVRLRTQGVPLVLLALNYALLLVAIKAAWFYFVPLAEYVRTEGWPQLALPFLLLLPATRLPRRLLLRPFRAPDGGLRVAAAGVSAAVSALLVLAALAAMPRLSLRLTAASVDEDAPGAAPLENVIAPTVRADTLCRTAESREAPDRRCDRAVPAAGHAEVELRLGWNKLSRYRVRVAAAPADGMALARLRVDPRFGLSQNDRRVSSAGSVLEIAGGADVAPLTGTVTLRVVGRELPGGASGEPTLTVSLAREAEGRYDVLELASCWALAGARAGGACARAESGPRR